MVRQCLSNRWAKVLTLTLDRMELSNAKGSVMEDWPEGIRIREFPKIGLLKQKPKK